MRGRRRTGPAVALFAAATLMAGPVAADGIAVTEVVASATDVRASVVVGDAVWLGTTGGLVRVAADGSITRVTSLDGLPEQRVRALAALPDGALALGTDHGLVLWKGGRVARTWPLAAVVALSADERGGVFVATADRKLWRITVAGGAEPVAAEVRGTTYALAFAAGKLWIGTSRGLWSWDGAAVARVRGRLPDLAVLSLAADGESVIVGTAAGVARVRGGRVRARSLARGLPIPDVRAVATAADGGIVVGTWGGGASVVDAHGNLAPLAGVPTTLRVQTLARIGARWIVGHATGALVDGVALDLGALPSNDVSALARTGETLWIGTFDRGLHARDRAGALRSWTEASGLLDNRVNALAVEGPAVWVALERGVCRIEGAQLRCWRGGEGPATGHASAILASDREVLVGSSGGLARWDGRRWTPIALPFDRITALARGDDGSVWVGSAEGLVRLSPTTLAVAEVRSAGAGTLHDDWVTLLAVDGAALWVGSYSAGLARIDADGALRVVEARAWLNPGAVALAGGARLFGGLDEGVLVARAGGVRRITEGLPSRDVTAIVAAADGGAWVATRAGLAHLTTR